MQCDAMRCRCNLPPSLNPSAPEAAQAIIRGLLGVRGIAGCHCWIGKRGVQASSQQCGRSVQDRTQQDRTRWEQTRRDPRPTRASSRIELLSKPPSQSWIRRAEVRESFELRVCKRRELLMARRVRLCNKSGLPGAPEASTTYNNEHARAQLRT